MISQPSATDSFATSRLFWPVVASTVGVAVVAATWSPPDWFSIAVVIAVIAAVGIPHGAVDHLTIEALEGHCDERSRRRFFRDYLLAMGGVGLVWLASPPLALMGFIVLSVHHFGQSDLAHLRLPKRQQLAIQWSRGLLLVGLPLTAHVAEVAPVIERLGGGDPATWSWLVDFWWLWCATLVAQHLAVGAAVLPGRRSLTAIGHEVVTVVALTALFLAADPLIGFAVYFGLWHSLAHLRVLADLLGAEPSPMRSLMRLTAPLTVASLVGLATISTGAIFVGRPDLLAPVVFVFVSMLTLPHMVVVERLWQRPSPSSELTFRSDRTPTPGRP